MTRIAVVAKPGAANTGVGRYAAALQEGLDALGFDIIPVLPAEPPSPGAAHRLLKRAGIDVRAFLLNYPLWASYPSADVYHLTGQNLGSLLPFRLPPGPVVVTVHDIIPYMLRHNPALSPYRNPVDRLFDRLALAGLRRADRLVADSKYTKRCLIEQLQVAEDRIEVIYLGIDHERFCRKPVPKEVFARYGLRPGVRYLIYVGSEDARKNLSTLVEALAAVRAAGRDDVELIKVGRAHNVRGREQLVALSVDLGIRSAIHFLEDVPEGDLPILYNLAEVCVMPSLYEGFGFPVLEAMACGTPVVSANAASLPEIAGDAALLVDAASPGELASAIRRLLDDRTLAAEMRRRGVVQAARFRWEETVRRTAKVYAELGCMLEVAAAGLGQGQVAGGGSAR